MGAAFVAFLNYYQYLHADHGIPASELDAEARSERGDHAVQLALDMQRATLALIGSHRRRTYAHDLVYGTHQLYMLFGKPWNAATEGSEHAHQDMKNYFHGLATHSPKGKHGDIYQVLRLTVVKRMLLTTKSGLLPHSNYAAMRANRILAEQAKKTAKAQSGPKGEKGKGYGVDKKMEACAARLQAEVVCSPCVP